MKDENTLLGFADCGYKSIAFTDHSPFKDFLNPFNPGHAMEWDEKESYFKSIRDLSEKYKDRIEVFAGMEMEFIPGHLEEMKEITEQSDILVLGQHFTYSKERGYTCFHEKGFVPNDEELDFYASAIESAFENGFPTILAHPDLYMIHKTEFGKREADIAHRICQAAEKFDIPLEINLCQIGRYYYLGKCKIMYPWRDFWEIASQYNLKVLYGLDYHGYYRIEDAERSYDHADKIIGEDIISKLNFIQKDQIPVRSHF